MEWVLIGFIAVAGASIGYSHHQEALQQQANTQKEVAALKQENTAKAQQLAKLTAKKVMPVQKNVVFKDLSS